ncbi:MAG: helix-turn-helix transcriptional regulator [Chloroflexi bacterium]|nr:helix-turn-helix transcriptional regulator [Chloroflexota bacterium]MBV9543074.1 helix-turn-helix transcriptional regulator [Chloroflexota bacterium]
MVSLQYQNSRLTAPRVRTARDSLLNDEATTLLHPVRGLLCEPTRTQIVRVLSVSPLTVGELAAALKRSKSATSQHLRVLRECGVVASHRRGRSIIYSLVTSPMLDAAVEMIDRAATIAAA